MDLSLEILNRIREAEQQADAAEADAKREARDMIKSVETACAAQERTASVEQRALYQQLMEKSRQAAEERLSGERENARAKIAEAMKAAEGRLDQAANLICERVVTHGNS